MVAAFSEKNKIVLLKMLYRVSSFHSAIDNSSRITSRPSFSFSNISRFVSRKSFTLVVRGISAANLEPKINAVLGTAVFAEGKEG